MNQSNGVQRKLSVLAEASSFVYMVATTHSTLSFLSSRSREHMSFSMGRILESNSTTLIFAFTTTTTHSTVLAGVTEVTSSEDLSEEKKDLLKHCALLNIIMPLIQHFLSKKFGKLTCIDDSQMLHCFINDEKNRIFRSDHHRIPKLMNRGRQLENNGGESKVNIDPTMHIIGTRYQTPHQKEYAGQYGSYFAVGDGTYGCTKYGVTLFPWVNTDCLGYTILLGIAISRSDNTVDVVAAGRLFSIASTSECSESNNEHVSVPKFLSFCSGYLNYNYCTGNN